MTWHPVLAVGFSDFPTLVQTVASGGVYALAIFYSWYIWQRATDNVQKAKAETRQHFERIENAVVALSFVLALVATVVWIYSTFFRHVEYFMRGTVRGIAQKAAPIGISGTNGAMYHAVSLEADSSEVSVYGHDVSSVEAGYELRWALASRDPIKSVILHIVQTYSTPDERPTADGKPHTIETFDRKRATIDLTQYGGAHPVDVRYAPDIAHPDKVGSLSVDFGSGRSALQVGDDTISVQSTVHTWAAPSFVVPLFAAAATASDLTFDRKTSALLRAQLGGADVPTQQSAARLIIAQGPRAFAFIEDSLKTTDVSGINRTVLVHNLADVVAQIAKQGTSVPPSLPLTFARAFYDLGDYAEAEKRYSSAGVSALMGPDDYSQRAYASQRLGHLNAALEDYNQVLTVSKDNYRKAMGHYGIGMVRLEMGSQEEAIKEFRKGIEIDKSVATALNNQAMTWATLNEKLDLALVAATEAVTVSDNSPAVLDTKGYVLFKLKRYDEAVSWLTRAAAGDPRDEEIQQHLAQAKARRQ